MKEYYAFILILLFKLKMAGNKIVLEITVRHEKSDLQRYTASTHGSSI